jgi:hypothetical protein
MRLEELGERICFLGPSNSGKSTLAAAIARKRGLRAVHLDQLHHLPYTDWEVRPSHEFVALHDEAIANDRWVMDGNYSKLFPKRFERATGVILMDISTSASLFRYVRRTLFYGRRLGALDGGQDSVKFAMLHHIGVVTPRIANAMLRYTGISPCQRSSCARSVRSTNAIGCGSWNVHQKWSLSRNEANVSSSMRRQSMIGPLRPTHYSRREAPSSALVIWHQ